MQIGVYGMGVMGANLARNLASRGFAVAVSNRSPERLNEFVSKYGSEAGLMGYKSAQEFVLSLEKPRKIIIMVNAGEAVDATIESLLPYMETGDIILDGGNSWFEDSKRRGKYLFDDFGIGFVGLGVSGGEEGALKGPSLMPGGRAEVVEGVMHYLNAIAAKDFNGGRCVTDLGGVGMGHYVKMVHNGIEYGIMQLIAECYDVMRKVGGMTNAEIADWFEGINSGVMESFLFESVVKVLREKDVDGGDLIDKILDVAEQKGTGAWTSVESFRRGVVCSVINEAVNARVLSGMSVERRAFAKIGMNEHASFGKVELEVVKDALYAAILVTYQQGLKLLAKTYADEGLKPNFLEILRIWQGGCIIRSKMLADFAESLKDDSDGLLILDGVNAEFYTKKMTALRYLCEESVKSSVAVPCFNAAFNYLFSLSSAKLPANVIQGLRDYFGAHTFRRVDKEGYFHHNWY